MMTVYLETSALLAWLLGEPQGAIVRNILHKAESIVSSAITVVEAERAILRAEREGLISPGERQRIRGLLAHAHIEWSLLEITQTIRARAAQPFPVEPVRTLNAIHLATALEFLLIYPDISILSLDKRVVENIIPLGFTNALSK
jgi:hypothetical protein